MHARAFTLVIPALALLLAPARARAVEEPADEATLDASEREMVERINAYRAGLGLQPLLPVPMLNIAAARHSADMIRRGYFGHVDPDGRTPFDRMGAVGYESDNEGETLASGHGEASLTLRQWQRSPPHDEALRDASYRVIGIGRVFAPQSRYRVYWTAVFGDAIPTAQQRAARAPSDISSDEVVIDTTDPITAHRPTQRARSRRNGRRLRTTQRS